MEQYLWFIPVGFVIGAFGTLIGVGGGFVLMPLLLLLYPYENPEIITGISLAVIFFNSLSGTAAYARMGRIDFKSGLLFSAATIPGAILGVISVAYVPRRLFDAIFGVIMILASTVLIRQPVKDPEALPVKFKHSTERHIIESNGNVHDFFYNPSMGVILSLFVGYISSLLGIGGGIIHVPALVRLLNFPVHLATATSHFVLVIMSLTGTLMHMGSGSFSPGIGRTIPLAIGALIGAQVGAWLSSRIQGVWIMRSLAIALGFVGIRILLLALR